MKIQTINKVNEFEMRGFEISRHLQNLREMSNNTLTTVIKNSLICQEYFEKMKFESLKMFQNFAIARGRYINNEWNLARTEERGDVPGWVLVVLMTTGLVTAIWTIAVPRLSTILRNSLDSMNSIR